VSVGLIRACDSDRESVDCQQGLKPPSQEYGEMSVVNTCFQDKKYLFIKASDTPVKYWL